MSLRDLINSEKEKILTRSVQGRRFTPYSPVLLSICALANLIFSIIVFNMDLFFQEIPYNTDVTIPLQFSNKNINIYIQLSDVYQSYLGYTKSINYSQLKGNATEKISSCYPLERGEKIYYPCGLIANSFFQDQITITQSDNVDVIKTDDITWPSERNLIKPTEYSLDQIEAPPLWSDYTEVPDLSGNQRLINWLNVSSFPTFRKLWGKANLNGSYNLNILSTYPFGQKNIVLAETNWIGTRNYSLAIGMMVAAASVLICMPFLIRYNV